jgi:5-methylcytosine-specific restriction enzyme subunit McrC
MIKIQNIYYMLAYAFQILSEEGYKKVAAEEFEYASDFCAAILARAVLSQVKRGLSRDYISKAEAVSVPIGRIDVSASLKQNSLSRKQLICEYDEFTEDAYLNRVLKTTAMLLLRCPEVSLDRKRDLKKALFHFSKVHEVNPTKIQWARINYNRNNATYKMLINICYLVIKGLLLTEQDGSRKLARYIDAQQMHRLYERFVLAYYRRHYPQYGASSAHIEWDVTGDEARYLPIMKSDITLRHNGHTLIIDTKYYQRSMAASGMFNAHTFHSHNLYQIFTYVKNMNATSSGNVSGLLLYAKTDEDIVPDCDYLMGGNRICVKTLDLNADFNNIARQLNEIAERMLR